MQLEVYTAIKAQLTTYKAALGLKFIGLWNNQFEREDVNVSIDYPCALIEFVNSDYEDLLNGVQRYEMDVNIHIGFKSFKNEDTSVLTLKQNINAKLHTFSSATSLYETRLLRRGESQNFDHNDIQDYIITYKVTGKDFSVSNLPQTEADIDTLNLINAPQLSNKVIRTNAPI
jgi:hypothetical protein